ncbi:MAG: 4Fe-4S dicluster domain-containing protein [Gemmatimonadales bacterium]
MAIRIPTPPTMKNHGNYVASLSEIVRWMGERAEALGVNLFPGFPAAGLLADGKRVIGVRTTPSGLDRDGNPGSGYGEPTDLTAKVTVLSEGTRGALAQAWQEWQGVGSANPQIFALGVKEVWAVKQPLDRVIHTLGWPLPRDAFGGSFCCPMGPEQVAIGLVVGLDARDAGLDVHELLQRMKLHPLFRAVLEGGELLEWERQDDSRRRLPLASGSLLGRRPDPDRRLSRHRRGGEPQGHPLRHAVGDLRRPDHRRGAGAGRDRRRRPREFLDNCCESYVASDLHRRRNMRLAFKHGFYRGGVENVLMTLTGGRFPGGRIATEADAAEEREVRPRTPFVPDNTLTFSKVDAVFKSGNATRDTIPSHLIAAEDIPGEVADFLSHVCPAGVYERSEDGLRVNPPNCVDCRPADVVGPRWTREGGSGPKYPLDVGGSRPRLARVRAPW